MQIEKIKLITREMVQTNPQKVFLFGDNLHRYGLGGQAGAMRGEPNAVGVATKISPGMNSGDFFNERDFSILCHVIRGDIQIAVEMARKLGGVIVIPKDGLGTGLADLPKRAPSVFEYLEEKIAGLEAVT